MIEDEELCAWCNGSGEGQHDNTTCQHCKGSGVEQAEKEERSYDDIHDELPDEHFKYEDFDNDTMY